MHQFKILVSVLTIVLANCVWAQRGSYNNLNNVPIIKSNYDLNPDGSYNYEYQTGNNIQAQEQGYVKNLGNPQTEAQVMQGSFSYTGDDGVQYSIVYVADDFGFQAQGAHLPTAPPIPEEIQKALAYNAAHPEEDNDGIVRAGSRGFGR